MPVDKTELAKDLATPEYQQIVRDELSKKDFVVRTKEEETTFQDNFKKDVVEKEIGPKISEVHTQYDKDVEAATGLKRAQNEKSYDFVKRALANNDSAALKKKVTDLEAKIAAGDGSEASKKALEEAERKYATALQEKDNEINTLRGEKSKSEVNGKLAAAYAGIKGKFVKTLPAMFDKTEKAILAEAQAIAVLGDDGEVYKGEQRDGKLVIAKDKSFNPIKMSTHLEQEFDGVIDRSKPKSGAGSTGGEKQDRDPSTITAETFEVPESVKTGDDLMNYMLGEGLLRGTPLFNEIWGKFRPALSDGKHIKVPAPAPAKK